jgi:hypothetical protein
MSQELPLPRTCRPGTGHDGQVPLLTADQFKATMEQHPVPVSSDEEPPFDFWPYFLSIPPADFADFDFSERIVTHAWTMPHLAVQHVLVRCEVPNVFLALVLDLDARRVRGHHLLDLNKQYGLTD